MASAIENQGKKLAKVHPHQKLLKSVLLALMGGPNTSSKRASDKVVEVPGFTFGFTQEDLPDALQLMSLLFGTMAIIVKVR